MTNLPILFIFDLDLTLIGRASNILEYKNILEWIKNNCKHKKINDDSCKINVNEWSKIIPENFLRPHLNEFLKEIKELFPTAEFFIFSNGTKKYVKLMVDYIEKKIKIKFNKLIIARDLNLIKDDHHYSKEITEYIEELIIKSLSKKYSKKILENNKELIFNNRTIIIDDNNYIWNNKPIINIPPYDYNPLFEFDKNMLNLIYKNSIIANYISNNHDQEFFPKNDITNKSEEEFKLNYHLFLAEMYRNNIENNKEMVKDDFFIKFIKLIKSRKNMEKPFTANYIKNVLK
jgi:hypothetical protein